MDDQGNRFGEIAERALTDVQASLEQSTKVSNTSAEIEHKRAFLQMFRRWEVLFKRADRGDVQADKWLIAEYYKTLGRLTPWQMDALTEELKARCTFFPTIKECLEVINPPRYSYASPFYLPFDQYDGERPARLTERARQRLLVDRGKA